MVVMEESKFSAFLILIPYMFSESIFEHNRCINRDWKLVGEGRSYFRIKHPFLLDYRNISWQNLVHFPELHQLLQYAKDHSRV